MLNERMDFLQGKVEGLINDLGQLANRVVEINGFIAHYMAEKSKAASEEASKKGSLTEGNEDVRPD